MHLPLPSLLMLLAALPAAAQTPARELSEILAEEEAVVASLHPEPLAETPVVTTIITDEQIRRMGARTLNEVLLTVPGFSRIQDHNEYFSALRGVYGSSQQKILVLRDGHRLNSRSYSMANFGPGIALNNVKRIEVMRGPASALYGDVATTGVVNIVTKSGGEVGGTELTAGGGDFGAVKAELLHGRDLGAGRELVIHASAYRTGGERRHVDAGGDYAPTPAAGTVVIDRFSGAWPGHDVGVRYRAGELTFTAARRYEHYMHPRGSAGGYGQLIDEASFRDFDGQHLGAAFETGHYGLAWRPALGPFALTLRPYFDTFSTTAIEPSRRTGELGNAAGQPRASVVRWKDRSYGVQAYASRPYETAGRGTLLAGLQAERLDVYSSELILSPDIANSSWRVADPEMLPSGKEATYAGFAQLKHHLSDALILNTGLRYDYKTRARYAQTVDRLSPRGALLYLPLPALSFRLSWGRAFSDPPYFYRYNTLGAAGYQGSDQLRPEILDSLQAGAEYREAGLPFARLNLFANDSRDVFFRDATGAYSNTGLVRVRGMELETGLEREGLSARGNYTYMHTLSDSVGYAVQDHKTANVPAHMGNLLLDWAPWRGGDGWRRGLWLHGALRAVGAQFAPVGVSAAPAVARRDPAHVSPAYAVLNAGLSLEDFARGLRPGDSLTLRVHVYNALDARYVQGGSVNLPYEQPGRWFLAQVGYQWY